MKRVRLAPLFALLPTGCSTVTGNCTLIGCTSGVRVHFAALPTEPFRVEVTTDGSDVAYVFDCTADRSRCRQEIFFPGLTEPRLTVTVRVGSVSRQTEVAKVVYQHSRPNGPNCGPECQTADVTALVPA